MKTPFASFILSLSSLLASGLAAESTPPKSAATAPAPAHSPASSAAASASAARTPAPANQATVSGQETVPPEKLPPSLAAKKAAEEANRAHIRPANGPFTMETPPPPPRLETKPPAPAAGYVWIPGHWTPVNGQWRWTPGEWGEPPTAASVWIESKYDSKTKQWTAGYWQPDRPGGYEPDVLEKEPAPAVKF